VDGAPPRGEGDDPLVLFFGELHQVIVAQHLQVEGTTRGGDKDECEEEGHRAHAHPGPFLPFLYHRTSTTCWSVGSAMPSSPLASASIRAGAFREATSTLRRLFSCCSSLSRRADSEILRLRSITSTRDQ